MQTSELCHHITHFEIAGLKHTRPVRPHTTHANENLAGLAGKVFVSTNPAAPFNIKRQKMHHQQVIQLLFFFFLSVKYEKLLKQKPERAFFPASPPVQLQNGKNKATVLGMRSPGLVLARSFVTLLTKRGVVKSEESQEKHESSF